MADNATAAGKIQSEERSGRQPRPSSCALGRLKRTSAAGINSATGPKISCSCVGNQSTIMMAMNPRESSARVRMDGCGRGTEKTAGVEVVLTTGLAFKKSWDVPHIKLDARVAEEAESRNRNWVSSVHFFPNFKRISVIVCSP